MKFYQENVQKYKLEMKETKLWCKIILQIGVEHTKSNDENYFYLYTHLGT
jgi:hypothetical protein